MSAEHKKAWKKKQHAKSSFESESNLLFGETELTLCIVVFFWPWSSKVVVYANYISNLLSIVFAKNTRIN